MNTEKETRQIQLIAERTGLREKHVRGVVELLQDGATVPFISRYRKEATGGMSDVEVALVAAELDKITTENFENEVLKSELPVLVDFFATWCGPCRMVVPMVEQIAEERSDIKVGKVNIDENPELANEFGIMSIPTLVVMEKGRIVNQAMGARPKKAILAML